MSILSALVLFAMIWFLTLFVVLPIRLKTQGDVGKIVPGTMAGAPAEPQMKRKMVIVSIITVILWAIITAIILSGIVTICDLDWFGRTDCLTGGGTYG